MYKLSAISILIGLGLLSAPAYAQSRDTNKPDPTNTIKLKAPNVYSSGSFIRCKVGDVAITSEGLGFTCLTQDDLAYLVSTDGGATSGGLAAFTSVVLKMAEKPEVYRNIRVQEAKGNALKVCGLIRGRLAAKDGRKCVQAMSLQISSRDSSINVGDAKPNSPNIPTEPARPD